MIEGVGRRGRRHKDVLDNLEEKRREKILELDRWRTRLHSVDSLLWRKLQTCRKTGYIMNEL